MSQFSIKATFDGADLVKGFKDVRKEVEGLEDAGRSTKASLDQMLQQKNSTSNYSRQLGQIKQQLTDLSVNYARLNDSDKNSEFGQAMAAKIEELKAKAIELKDVMDNVNSSLSKPSGGEMAVDFGQQWSEIQKQAEQTKAKFEGIKKISSGVASGFAAVQGAAALLGGENENLQKSLLKVQSAMAIAQGIGGIWDLIEGFMQISLALGLTTTATTSNTVATAADTAATTANTTATIANTAANAANTTANSANTASTISSTAATVANTTATGTATAATGTLTAVVGKLKGAFSGLGKLLGGAGGPIALFGAIAVGAIAVAGNLSKIERAINGISKEAKAAIAVAELNEEITKLGSGEMAKATLRLKELANGFKQLGDDANAKKQYILDYKDELSDLGIEINNANDAENVFINNTDAYIKALQHRAMAEAARQKAVEDYKKGLEEEAALEKNLQQVIADNSNGNTDRSFWEDLMHAIIMGSASDKGANIQATHDLAAGVDAEIRDKNIQAATDALYDARKRNEERVARLYQFAAEKDAEADKLLGSGKKTGGKTTGGGSTATQDIYDKESLRAAEKAVQDLQDKLNRMDVNSPDFEKTKTALFEAQTKVEEIRKLMAQPVSQTLVDQYDEAQKKINDIVKEYNIGVINEEEALKQIETINAELKKLGLKPIEVKIKTESKTLVEQYDEAQKKINEIAKEYNIGIINEEKAKEQIDAINAELQKLGLKPIEIKLKPDSTEVKAAGKWDGFFDKDRDTTSAADSVVKAYNLKLVDKDYAKEAIDAINVDRINAGLPPIHLNLDIESVRQGIDQAMQMFDSFSAIGNVVSSINSVYESFKNLPDAMDEAENGWERFMVGFEAGMQIMSVFTTILGTINTLMTTFQTIQELVTASKLKDATASGVQAAADTEAAGATMTKAGANMAETATGAGKSVSWLPIVGPILAIAAIGAIMGVMLGVMSKSKFAAGGIVSNASKIGDFNIARVNGGEMILNNRQQANLFNMLDHNRIDNQSMSPQNVSFRIQGDSLVGVIDNYNKKRGRL